MTFSGKACTHGVRTRRSVLMCLCAASVGLPTTVLARQSGGLLSPDVIGRPRAPVGPTTGPDPTSGLESPQRARSMASSTATAIVAVARGLEGAAAKHRTHLDRHRELLRKLAGATADKERKLEEYRQGQFCSGCGLTRSEIQAKGERFPHAGQSVIRATPAQIAAKEAQLNAGLDNIRGEADAEKKKSDDQNKWIDEALDQLYAGVRLWTTAVDVERRLMLVRDAEREDRYRAERQKIGDQVSTLTAEARGESALPALTSIRDDLTMWRRMLAELERQRSQTRTSANTELREAELRAMQERSKVQAEVNAILARITEPRAKTPAATTIGSMSMAWNVAGTEGSARSFRMGDYNPANNGVTRPTVVWFMDLSYQLGALRGYQPDGFHLASALARIDDAIDIVDGKIQQLRAATCASAPQSQGCA